MHTHNWDRQRRAQARPPSSIYEQDEPWTEPQNSTSDEPEFVAQKFLENPASVSEVINGFRTKKGLEKVLKF